MNTVATPTTSTQLPGWRHTASQYAALTKPRVTQLAVFCAVIGMFLATPGMVPWSVLIGGAVMCYFQLGLTIPVFMRQLDDAVSVNTLMVGLIKAPVFAFVISLVGCYEGFQVERNASSVGLLTTRSVVEAVFLAAENPAAV